MNIEHALLSKAVNNGLVENLVARGITARHFMDEQNRAVFDTMVRHMSAYGAPPSREAIMMRHPNYRLDIVQDDIEFLLDEFVKNYQIIMARRMVVDLAERIDDPYDRTPVDELFLAHAERVAQAVPSSRVSRLSDVRSRIARYNEMKAIGRIPGIQFGIPSIDRLVLGVQGHELVVITAPSSYGKSSMLLYNCFMAYLRDPQSNPLFISLEMDGEPLLRRLDTMATNFQYHALRALELDGSDMARWERWAERAENAPNDIMILDDISECTVEKVMAETLRWKPSATFVDYFGIMTPSMDGSTQQWQSMANMAKALKRIPRKIGIPIFTAAQTNREGFRSGVRADNVADTIEIFRSADIMVGLNWDPDVDPRIMTVELVKNRDGPKGNAELHWDLSTMEFYEKTGFGSKTQSSSFGIRDDKIGAGQGTSSFAQTPPTPATFSNPFMVQR